MRIFVIYSCCVCFIEVLTAGCSSSPRIAPTYYVQPRATESLEVRVVQNDVPVIAGAIRSALASAQLPEGTTVTVSTRPDYQAVTSTAETSADVYAEALKDAQAKAKVLARNSGLTLGPIESIQEILGNVNGALNPQNKGNAIQPSMVRVLPNQPVILFVTFRLAGSTDEGAAHVFSVYGFSAQLRGSSMLNAPQLVAVDAQALAPKVNDALAAIQDIETIIRQTLDRENVPQSALRITRSDTYVGR